MRDGQTARHPPAYGVAMTVAQPRRVEPDRLAGEPEMLASWLDYYRASLLHKCADLTPAQLVERSCPPSPMSLAGLVRHMTEMERAYAHRLAEPDLALYYCTDGDPEADFEGVTPAGVPADLRTYTEHCERSRTIMEGHAPDDRFGRTSPYSVRWVQLYLIKEYARHLGHADLLRERIDGATGE